MVEFMLVLPIFLIVILAFVEFGFAFSTLNSLNFTTRDLALYASEAGNQGAATAASCRSWSGNSARPQT